LQTQKRNILYKVRQRSPAPCWGLDKLSFGTFRKNYISTKKYIREFEFL
jgi:hypothetical protein